MLLTLTTTHRPATDLGYLPHKHPDRFRSSHNFGTATVFYPEADEARCTAALVLEIDPVRLAFGRNAPDFTPRSMSTTGRAASSSSHRARRRLQHGALGLVRARQDLADSAIPLQIAVPVVPCRGGPRWPAGFEPLGWQVEDPIPPIRPSCLGSFALCRAHLTGTPACRMRRASCTFCSRRSMSRSTIGRARRDRQAVPLSGEGWLATHPDRELITGVTSGVGAIDAEGLHSAGRGGDETPEAPSPARGEALPPRAATPQRAAPGGGRGRLLASGAISVIDLGCGPAAVATGHVPQFRRVAGTDVSRLLQIAARRLHVETMSERQSDKLKLFQSALTYEDARFAGFDAAVVMESSSMSTPRATLPWNASCSARRGPARLS